MVKKILIIILLIGLCLRWYRLGDSTPFFYDQGRDALNAYKILEGDFVLVGQTTDMHGLSFGPLWWYLLTVLYFVSSGHPLLVTKLVSLVDIATIVIIFMLGKRWLGVKTGLVASLFWAVGTLPVSYSRMLANPSTTAFWVITLLYLFTKISQNFKLIWILPILWFLVGILFQLNAAGSYLFFPTALTISFLIKGKVDNWRWWVLSFFAFVATFLPQVIFEIRNSFPAARALSEIFLKSGASNMYGVLRSHWINFEFELSDYTFFTQKKLSLIFLLFGSFYIFRKMTGVFRKFFLSWLALPLLAFFILYPREESHPFYLLTWVPVAIISLSFLIVKSAKLSLPLGLCFVIIYMYFNYFGLDRVIKGKEYIAQPADHTRISFNDEIKIIDYLYESAERKPFGYHIYTLLPYWADEHWQYLFSWYGKRKYGYIPTRYSGNPLYLIYPFDPYLTSYQKEWLNKFRDDGKGKLVSIKQFGPLTVEEFLK